MLRCPIQRPLHGPCRHRWLRPLVPVPGGRCATARGGVASSWNDLGVRVHLVKGRQQRTPGPTTQCAPLCADLETGVLTTVRQWRPVLGLGWHDATSEQGADVSTKSGAIRRLLFSARSLRKVHVPIRTRFSCGCSELLPVEQPWPTSAETSFLCACGSAPVTPYGWSVTKRATARCTLHTPRPQRSSHSAQRHNHHHQANAQHTETVGFRQGQRADRETEKEDRERSQRKSTVERFPEKEDRERETEKETQTLTRRDETLTSHLRQDSSWTGDKTRQDKLKRRQAPSRQVEDKYEDRSFLSGEDKSSDKSRDKRLSKTREDKTREDKTRQELRPRQTRQDKMFGSRQDKTRQDKFKTRQDKTRQVQDKTKTRQEKEKEKEKEKVERAKRKHAPRKTLESPMKLVQLQREREP